MKKCSTCDMENVNTAKYCGYCGKKFESFICYKCNFENTYGEFCIDCGTRHIQKDSSIVIFDNTISTNPSNYLYGEVKADGESNVYSFDGNVLITGDNKRRHVIIQDGCKVICDKTYYARGKVRVLEEVNIPDSVQIIGENAFDSQIKAKIRIPSGLIEIRKEAFYRIKSFPKELDLSHTKLKVLGKHAFLYSSVHSLILPDTIEYIEFPIVYGSIHLKVSAKIYGRIIKLVDEFHNHHKEKSFSYHYPTARVEVIKSN